MQFMALSRQPTTSLSRVQTRVMPTPQVQKTMVMQPVHLRPMGNTVSMTVPADNPFAGGRTISVHTQVSGGMAQADPTQRSRQISVFNGLSGDIEDRAYAAFNQMDPKAANTNRASYDTSPSRGYWETQVKNWDAEKAAKSSANWSKAGDIFTSSLNAASNITSQLTQAKIAAANAAAAAANAEIERTRQGAFMSRLTDVSQYGAGMAARKSITIPLLVIGGGALAVALFLFLKKKKAASAPAAA